MKRTFPLLITFVSGMLLIVASFIPYTEDWKEDVVVWFDVLAAIAFLLGGGNLLMMHLQKISDRKAGWGYSAVVLISFVLTLVLGLGKFGSVPAANTERYGEVAVSLPPAEFPVVTEIAGVLPPGTLPAVVRGQLSQMDDGQHLKYIGWMSDGQRKALDEFEFEAGWHHTVAELSEKAQPPAELKGRVDYHAQLQRLFFAGVMDDRQQQMLQSLGDSPAWQQSIAQLAELSRKTHSVPLQSLPAGVAIPEQLADVVTFDPDQQQLRCHGPLSRKQRDELVAQFPPGTPLQEQSREALVSALLSRGELSAAQSSTAANFHDEAPTRGEQYRLLMQKLLKPSEEDPRPTLNADQKKFLLTEINRERKWEVAVNSLFLAAHQTKYPWSGAYDSEGSAFWYIYEYGIWPLTATMFSLLAFYVASAAFRAFRAKNPEAILLLGTAFIILLGRTYAGTVLTAWMPNHLHALTIPEISVLIMVVFTTAGNRAIMIGIALGIASTSLKVLFGVDRSYLGSDRE